MNSPSASPDCSRRAFLQSAAAALAAAALPTTTMAQAATKKKKAAPAPLPATMPPGPRNPYTYRFAIGDFEAWSISDGHMLFREGLNLMWPEAERGAMREHLVHEGERLDALPLYVNLLLVKIGNEVALFDAGFGPGRNPEIGWLTAALNTIGVAPEKVTHAFLSHAHADHLNGFVSGNQPVFRNAAVHCMKEEVDFWRGPSPDFSRSKRAKGPLPNMIKTACANFDVLQPNLQFHRSGDALLNGAITIEAAPGHTAGHAVFRVKSGKESLLHFMDVAHHHTLMFTNPAWGIAFDHEPEQAIDTRKKLFAKLAATHERAYGFHLPWPGIGKLVTAGKGYTWQPERWSWGS